MEPTYGSTGNSDQRDQFHWTARGRHWRDEYHADLRDRAHARDRPAQSHWRPTRRYSPSVFAGSGCSHSRRRHYWHLDWGLRIDARAHVGAFDSRDPVLSVGIDRVHDLRGRGPVLRLLSRQSGSQPRSHRLLALRIKTFSVTDHSIFSGEVVIFNFTWTTKPSPASSTRPPTCSKSMVRIPSASAPIATPPRLSKPSRSRSQT